MENDKSSKLWVRLVNLNDYSGRTGNSGHIENAHPAARIVRFETVVTMMPEVMSRAVAASIASVIDVRI